MAKKDDIILIIAKALSEQDLTAEEKDLCCDLTISHLVSEHGLNDIQSRHVLNWCAIQQSKLSNKMKKEVLEEGLFSFLKRRKNKNINKLFKKILDNKNVRLSNFLKDVSYLVKAIKKEKGISDYRTKEDNYDPSSDYNIEKITHILKTLNVLKKEFKSLSSDNSIKVTSAKKESVNESLAMKDLPQKAVAMEIVYKLKRLDGYGYYNKDMTTIAKYFLNSVRKHFKLSSKETKQIAGRFLLFITSLIDDLSEELNDYKNAVQHGKLTLSRNYTPPVRYKRS